MLTSYGISDSFLQAISDAFPFAISYAISGATSGNTKTSFPSNGNWPQEKRHHKGRKSIIAVEMVRLGALKGLGWGRGRCARGVGENGLQHWRWLGRELGGKWGGGKVKHSSVDGNRWKWEGCMESEEYPIAMTLYNVHRVFWVGADPRELKS